MTDQRRVRCARTTLIQQGFETTAGTGEEEGFQSSRHITLYHGGHGEIRRALVSAIPSEARDHCCHDNFAHEYLWGLLLMFLCCLIAV